MIEAMFPNEVMLESLGNWVPLLSSVPESMETWRPHGLKIVGSRLKGSVQDVGCNMTGEAKSLDRKLGVRWRLP